MTIKCQCRFHIKIIIHVSARLNKIEILHERKSLFLKYSGKVLKLKKKMLVRLEPVHEDGGAAAWQSGS